MKIRCIENSIRLRLRKSDIKQLQSSSNLINTINFPDGNALEFGIHLDASFEIAATLIANKLLVSIPKSMAFEWIDSNEVGLEQYIVLDNKEKLHILIEKDFPCKHVEEDFEDTFHELQPEETNC